MDGAPVELAQRRCSHRFVVGLFLGFSVGLLVGVVLAARDRWVAARPQPAHSTALQGDQQFVELVSGGDLVLVDFHAAWCGPCKRLSPRILEIASAYSNRIRVLTVDVEKNPGTARLFGVQSIPDVRFYKDGVLRKVVLGLKDRSVYTGIIDALLDAGEASKEADREAGSDEQRS